MLSEDLVREIVALRRRVERLEAQEPVAGALRGANAEIDAQGNATLAGGLNVGTATGAGAGEIKAGGLLTAPGLRYQAIQSIADDGVYSFTVHTGRGVLVIWNQTTCIDSGMYVYQAVAGGAQMNQMSMTGDFERRTGALTGTTGTDGKITVSAHTDGKIYIENRSGGTRSFGWAIMA